jgi:AcrR family transcriptional regulator
MASTVKALEPRHRPGGRTARTTDRIHAAVLELLTVHGHEACTFQNVAVRAGIERSTLYRRYSDRWMMIIEAYAARAELEVAVTPAGDFRTDLKQLIWRFARFWSTKLAEAMLAAIIAARGTPAQDQITQFLDRRFADFDDMFDQAIARGDLPPSIDRSDLLERLAGAVIFHMLIANRMVDEPWVERLLDDTIRSIAEH